VAFTTAPSKQAGLVIVRTLVERRLIACGMVLPGGVSIYRWQGKVEETDEALVLLKTTSDRWDALAAVLPSLHPYEVPELIAVSVAGGHPPYLEWLIAETRDGAVETA
jgi:periplasmic divalent cation tolerance protein